MGLVVRLRGGGGPCRSVLGPTWLAFQIASGAVLAESAFPLHLLLQYRQSDLTNRWGRLTGFLPLPRAHLAARHFVNAAAAGRREGPVKD